jgi:hypothetical protein
VFLLLVTWVGFAHTPGTQIRNTLAIEGIYLNGTTSEMFFPHIRQHAIEPYFSRMDAEVDSDVSEQLKLVAFASRAILETREIIALIRKLPARDQYTQKPVTAMTVRTRDIQFGRIMSLCCHLQYMQ